MELAALGNCKSSTLTQLGSVLRCRIPGDFSQKRKIMICLVLTLGKSFDGSSTSLQQINFMSWPSAISNGQWVYSLQGSWPPTTTRTNNQQQPQKSTIKINYAWASLWLTNHGLTTRYKPSYWPPFTLTNIRSYKHVLNDHESSLTLINPVVGHH